MKELLKKKIETPETVFFHLEDSIYLSFFREEAILLDLKLDTYTVLQKKQSQLLARMLQDPWIFVDNYYVPLSKSDIHFTKEESTQFLDYLRKKNILKKKNFYISYPFEIDKKPYSSGVFSASWRLPLSENIASLSFKTVAEALWTLLKVHCIVQRKKFDGLIKSLQYQAKKSSSFSIPQMQDLDNLVNCLNKACLLYPQETKCLEWATACVLMALRREWKCNLVVGVQNYPFIAHAWVEHDGQVIGDSKEFPENLSIILREPFRKRASI